MSACALCPCPVVPSRPEGAAGGYTGIDGARPVCGAPDVDMYGDAAVSPSHVHF